MILFSLLFYFSFTWSSVLSKKPSPPPACQLGLPDKHVLLDSLKFKVPKGTLQLECPTGFLNSDLKDKKLTINCTEDGKLKYEDLLCKSDFHKLNFAQKIQAKDLPSKLLSCSAPAWDVYKVGRDAAGAKKILYYVCLDRNTMRTKFAFKPASNTKPVVRFTDREGGVWGFDGYVKNLQQRRMTPAFSDKNNRWKNYFNRGHLVTHADFASIMKPVTRFTNREGDVWGFDGYGASTEDKIRLSLGYVEKSQKKMTQFFFGKTYSYYFNRGHLVAYADFADVDDQKATVEYLNAAPQWDVLNK